MYACFTKDSTQPLIKVRFANTVTLFNFWILNTALKNVLHI